MPWVRRWETSGIMSEASRTCLIFFKKKKPIGEMNEAIGTWPTQCLRAMMRLKWVYGRKKVRRVEGCNERVKAVTAHRGVYGREKMRTCFFAVSSQFLSCSLRLVHPCVICALQPFRIENARQSHAPPPNHLLRMPHDFVLGRDQRFYHSFVRDAQSRGMLTATSPRWNMLACFLCANPAGGALELDIGCETLERPLSAFSWCVTVIF